MKPFSYLWVKRFSNIRKEAQSFFADFSICTPTYHVRPRKSTVFFRARNSIQLTFFKISQILHARFRCMMSFTSPDQPFYLGFLFWHLWTTHPPRVCVNTCAQVCTKLTHALSWKVLSLTKPKGRIYKTKSLGHYIYKMRRRKKVHHRRST